MKTKPFYAILTILFIFGMSHHASADCVKGNNNAIEQIRQIADFNTITVEGPFDVRISCDEGHGLRISGDENILPHIDTKVDNRNLTINANKSICTSNPIRIAIGVPALEKLRASGACDILVSGMKNGMFGIHVSGASDVTVKGETDLLTADVRGTGSLSAGNLIAKSAEINLTGAGDVAVHVREHFEASVAGAGDIVCHGAPKIVKKKISGCGDILFE